MTMFLAPLLAIVLPRRTLLNPPFPSQRLPFLHKPRFLPIPLFPPSWLISTSLFGCFFFLSFFLSPTVLWSYILLFLIPSSQAWIRPDPASPGCVSPSPVPLQTKRTTWGIVSKQNPFFPSQGLELSTRDPRCHCAALTALQEFQNAFKLPFFRPAR